LEANPSVRLVALTQVDTSTGVLNDIAALAKAAKAVRPDVLVAVDGVCSFGAERFDMSEWGVDAALTCSQKAMGVPPGLCIFVASPAAIAVLQSRQTRVPSYYANLLNWLPIMRAYEARKPSYFATPAVNLIRALKVSLDQLLAQTMAKRVEQHERTSRAFKAAVTALGLRQVPTSPTHAANTLSAIYFPTDAGVDASKILPSMVASGIVAAGGLHKDIKATYFRVGHMSHSVMSRTAEKDDVRKVVAAIETALQAAGVAAVQQGAGLAAYDAALKQ
jgi:alanine-glyoxylate transaminase/serine-glyoxylate transaminase/serine-pyruvate transaminase